MSTAMTDVVTSQEEFAKLEKDFAALYQSACTADAAMFKAKLAASVAAHRLGLAAIRLKPLVEAEEGVGSWGKYLQRHDMAPRTVQRAMRIARWLDEATCAKMTLTDADDFCAAKEAVERGNMKSVDEWRTLKKKLADAREALEKQESERERALAAFEEQLEAKAQKEYAEEAKQLDVLANRATQLLESDAKAQADQTAEALSAVETAEALSAVEMAEALKDEGKVSIPNPRAQGDTMPSEVAAEFGDDEEDDEAERDEEVVSDLLNAEQIEALSERLLATVSERPKELTDSIEDPQVLAAIAGLREACNGDAEIAYGVMAVWFSNNGL